MRLRQLSLMGSVEIDESLRGHINDVSVSTIDGALVNTYKGVPIEWVARPDCLVLWVLKTGNKVRGAATETGLK